MPRHLRSFLAVIFSLGILSAALAWQNAGSDAKPPSDTIAVLQTTGPTYWKGNLHTHSLWSDGDDFPDMIADWYKQHGYHFLTLSDHNVLSDGDKWIDVGSAKASRELAVKKYLARFGEAWVERRKKDGKTPQVRLKPLAEFRSVLEEPGRYLLIPGEEITHRFAKKPIHMNAINLRDVIQPTDGGSASETIAVNLRAVAEQRKKKSWTTVAFLNHPNFGWGVKAEDMLTEELRYFEIFNGHPGVRNYGDPTHVGSVATDGDFLNSDIYGFQAQYPYLATHWNRVFVDGTPGCCDDETTLDTEWSTAMSNSRGSLVDTSYVWVYEAAEGFGDFGTVYQQMVNDNYARVANISYGLPEYWFLDDAPSLLTSWHATFNQMIGQGWTIMAASGDGGTTAGCSDAVAVLYPESDPDVISVGGTQLELYSDGSFDTEVAWTGDTSTGSCSVNHGGGGGGCSEVWAAPGYQTVGSPYCGTGSRSVPDVALNASDHSGQNYYFEGSLQGVAGTSIASPMMSGFIAQENAYSLSMGNACDGTHNCAPVGDVHYDIYAEGGYNEGAPHYPFYDITSGCTSNDITNKYGTGAWCAAPGYDAATGWGSFNALQMAWAINYEDNLAYSAPSVVFSGPAKSTWYNTDQEVSWSVNANSNPTGIAGFTQGWDSIPSDPSFDSDRNDSNSFFSGPQYPNATSGCLSLTGGFGCAGGVSQGCHTAHVRAWSNQGGTSGDVTYGPICYDDVDPTVTAANSPAANGAGYNNASVKITLTATDPGDSGASGIKATYYTIDNTTCSTSDLGACTVYSGPITITATGTHYVEFFARDVAGNFSTVNFDYVFIDEVPPVTTATLSGTLSGSVYDTAVKVTLSATDNYSGVASTHYSIDGGATTTYSGAFTISALGSHTVKFYSVDNAGNTEATKSVSFSIASLTTTTLSATPNPALVGQTVTLAAKVVASLSGTPTGTVTFKSGATTIGTGTLAGGVATLTTTTLPVGADSLTASYGGAATFLASTASAFSEDIQDKTTTTLASSANPSTLGESVTFTATVTATGGATPTGTVTFEHGGVVFGTATLSGGKATLAYSGLTVGDHTMTAIYGGSSTDATSTSSGLTQVVHISPTNTTLASSANPSTLGESVTFTATVTATGGATPTGTVTFEHGGVVFGTATLSGGKATLAYNGLTVGDHTMTAIYGGSSTDATSTSSGLTQVVHISPTNTTLASSANPSTLGESVTFTATVTATGGATPTGTVTFEHGGVVFGTATLSGGKATLAYNGLTVGDHTMTAIYGGSSTDATSTSSGLTQVVHISPTNTTLASSANPSTLGESVTFTATVTATGGATPTGTVTFEHGGVVFGTATLSGGKATLAYNGLTVGDHTMTAIYGGSSTDATSTSSGLTQVVHISPTNTTLASSANPSTLGESVTFTATVTATGGATPTGTVTFEHGGVVFGTATLSGGKATLAYNGLTVGDHTMTAIYGGSSTDATSTSSGLTQVVNP